MWDYFTTIFFDLTRRYLGFGASPTARIKASGNVAKQTTTMAFKFENFFALSTLRGTSQIDSEKMIFAGTTWWVRVWPSGSNDETKKAGFVSLYFGCDSDDRNVSFTVSLKSTWWWSSVCQSAFWKTKKGQSTGWQKFISVADLQKTYCSNDFVTVYVNLTVFDNEGSNPLPPPPIQAPLDPKYADVALMVDGTRLPAHKARLCPSSPVFDAMFRNPMRESACNEVVVSDHSVAAVKAMLQFIHTGTVQLQDLQTLLPELLALSVYYQMEEFRAFLDTYWTTSLTADNVLDCLHAAQALECAGFQEKTLFYMTANAKKLMTKSEFTDRLDMDVCRMMIDAMAS